MGGRGRGLFLPSAKCSKGEDRDCAGQRFVGGRGAGGGASSDGLAEGGGGIVGRRDKVARCRRLPEKLVGGAR